MAAKRRKMEPCGNKTIRLFKESQHCRRAKPVQMFVALYYFFDLSAVQHIPIFTKLSFV